MFNHASNFKCSLVYERTCGNRHCDKTFHTDNAQQQYCGKACRKSEQNARWYARYRDMKIAYAKEYQRKRRKK